MPKVKQGLHADSEASLNVCAADHEENYTAIALKFMFDFKCSNYYKGKATLAKGTYTVLCIWPDLMFDSVANTLAKRRANRETHSQAGASQLLATFAAFLRIAAAAALAHRGG